MYRIILNMNRSDSVGKTMNRAALGTINNFEARQALAIVNVARNIFLISKIARNNLSVVCIVDSLRRLQV